MTNREESDRRLMADAVSDELKQLTRLLEIEPPLGLDELSHRTAWPKKDLRRMLKLMRIDRK